jgi:hypothetical protein
MRVAEPVTTAVCYGAIWLADQAASRPPLTVSVVPWGVLGVLARQ